MACPAHGHTARVLWHGGSAATLPVASLDPPPQAQKAAGLTLLLGASSDPAQASSGRWTGCQLGLCTLMLQLFLPMGPSPQRGGACPPAPQPAQGQHYLQTGPSPQHGGACIPAPQPAQGHAPPTPSPGKAQCSFPGTHGPSGGFCSQDTMPCSSMSLEATSEGGRSPNHPLP